MGTMACKKCGHVWRSRVPRPLKCPQCFLPKWWIARRDGLVPDSDISRRYDPRTLEAFDINPNVPRSAQQVREFEQQHPEAGRYLGEVPKMPPQSVEPGMESLRAIASGRIPAGNYPGGRIEAGEALFVLDQNEPRLNTFMDEPGAGHDQELEMCPYSELDREANEIVYCGLPKHGPKIKHTEGRRESA